MQAVSLFLVKSIQLPRIGIGVFYCKLLVFIPPLILCEGQIEVVMISHDCLSILQVHKLSNTRGKTDLRETKTNKDKSQSVRSQAKNISEINTSNLGAFSSGWLLKET